LIPSWHWPPIQYKAKRGITLDEHQKILAREQDPAGRAYYNLLSTWRLWYCG
jgi:hypothetical protein